MPTSTEVTPGLLRDWTLPEVPATKYGRGSIVVIGGARRAPGAAMLAGTAALRVGAGRLTLAVAASVAPHVAVAFRESGVVGLRESRNAHIVGASLSAAADDLGGADAVLVGPGLDDPTESRGLLRELRSLLSPTAFVVLDAFALGVLAADPALATDFAGRLVLTPNLDEAARLLGRDIDDADADLAEIAHAHGAVVSCYGIVAAPGGELWRVPGGSGGLATGGSGDVLAGIIVGLGARGAPPDQAAVWGTYLHATAGDRLATTVGSVGYLAGELVTDLPAMLDELAPRR